MEKINNLLTQKQFKIIKGNRKRNYNWEQANEMAKYLNLKTTFIMMLFKKFGKNKVLTLQSYLKDFDGNCRLEQALVYRLNNPLTNS